MRHCRLKHLLQANKIRESWQQTSLFSVPWWSGFLSTETWYMLHALKLKICNRSKIWISTDTWPLAVWRCVKSKDRRGDKSSWKCFNLSEPLFLIVRLFRLQSQILFSALDIWSTAAKCALRSFALLFPSDLTQFTSHSAIREINNILTLHCCIYSLLPAGTWFLMKNFPETVRKGCSLQWKARILESWVASGGAGAIYYCPIVRLFDVDDVL